MKGYETDSKEAMVNTAPLFASVWLALFFTLRENYYERRNTANENKDRPQSMDSK